MKKYLFLALLVASPLFAVDKELSEHFDIPVRVINKKSTENWDIFKKSCQEMYGNIYIPHGDKLYFRTVHSRLDNHVKMIQVEKAEKISYWIDSSKNLLFLVDDKNKTLNIMQNQEMLLEVLSKNEQEQLLNALGRLKDHTVWKTFKKNADKLDKKMDKIIKIINTNLKNDKN